MSERLPYTYVGICALLAALYEHISLPLCVSRRCTAAVQSACIRMIGVYGIIRKLLPLNCGLASIGWSRTLSTARKCALACCIIEADCARTA